MKNKILWIISVIPLVITLFVLRFLPDEIPAHYDFEGNIDRWGSKYEELIFPIIILVMALFWQLFVWHFDKKGKNAKTEKEALEAKSNKNIILLAAICEAVIFGIMHFVFMYSACKEATGDMTKSAFDSFMIINVLFGLMFIIIGNYLPRAKQNGIVGLRTGKTMNDEEVWKKANRFAGKLFIIAGLLTVIESLIIGGVASTMIMVGILLVVAIVSAAYAAMM
ncbi:MAG: SdpI family protein [Lachnospiraceae bacterium]|nr:SdpI family protein [Lachnospiraceae bacterium]